MKKSLLLIFVLVFAATLAKAQDNKVTITHINGIDLPKDTTKALLLGTNINVKATYTNPDKVKSVKVALVNSTAWATDWVSKEIVLDSINGKIDVMLPVPGNFPLFKVPEGKNDVQYIQVKVQYESALVQPYEMVQVTNKSAKNVVVITHIGTRVFPDTTKVKEFDNKVPLKIKGYYTNPGKATAVQVSLVNATNWATDWKSVAIAFKAPFTGVIDTTITVPADFPVYNVPEGKNNVQYIQMKVTYDDGLKQPYELIRLKGEAVIVESIEDYLTSLTMTVNDDTSKVFKHSGWTFTGDQQPGYLLHFKGTYKTEKNGNKATSVSVGVLDFKGDWSGQNYGYSQIVANKEMGNLNGVIDFKMRIPSFFPTNFLIAGTDDASRNKSNQLAQVRVTYNEKVDAPIKGGIYSNFWMDIFAPTTPLTTCMGVPNVKVSKITNNSAALDWGLGNESSWDVLVAEEGTIRNPDASTDFKTINAYPYVISGLKSGTTYELYMRSVCNPDTLNRKMGAYSTKITFKTTGVTEAITIEGNDFNIYPNPVKDVIRINADGIYNVQIVDITGRVRLSKLMSAKSEELNVAGLTNGLYIIRLNNGAKMHAKKFIKE